METPRDDDRDLPDEIDQASERDSQFGEHEDDAQESEWSEDAREGGAA